MIDRVGTLLEVGDIVVYSTAYNNCATLHIGKVTEIKTSEKQQRCFITRIDTSQETPPFAWKPGIVDQFNASLSYPKTNKVLVINNLNLMED